MELDYVILGFLDWKELTGYELKSLFSRLDFLPWSGNNNQIYTTLVGLEKRGLVEKKTVPQEKLPAQKRYSATAEGRALLREAVLGPSTAPAQANEFLLHLMWSASLTEQELMGLIDRYQQGVVLELMMCRERARRGGEFEARTPREEFLWQMIGRNRTMALQNELNWLVQLRNGLAGKEGSS